jgi:hypothetical protein
MTSSHVNPSTRQQHLGCEAFAESWLKQGLTANADLLVTSSGVLRHEPRVENSEIRGLSSRAIRLSPNSVFMTTRRSPVVPS